MTADAAPIWGPIRWLAASATLVLVAVRLLYPSVDADAGSGAGFALVGLAVGALLLIDAVLRRGVSAHPPGFLFALAATTWFAAYRYPSAAMLGEWAGAIFVVLAIQRVDSPVFKRQIVFLLAALAVGEAMLAINQATVVIPEMLAKLAKNDPTMLRELELSGMERSFALQARLEARLPWGTFGHTNSLAGFLALVAPVLVGLQLGCWRVRPSTAVWIARLIGLALLAVVCGALMLAKCRSAMLGVVVGFVVWFSSTAPTSVRRRLWWMGLAGLIVGAAALVAWPAATTAAKQSLGYRLEYWQSSIPIVVAHPWTGVGFGAFRDYYLEHKLPYSSEEIADPHNFLVELAACCGLPTAVAYLIWLVLAFRRLAVSDADTMHAEPEPQPWTAWFGTLLALLAAGGLVLTLGLSSSPTELGFIGFLIALWMVRIVAGVSQPTVRDFRLAAAAGFLGFHVHLLAAGGIGQPGAMLAAWSLAVAGMPTQSTESRKIADWSTVFGLAATVGLLLAFGVPGMLFRSIQRDLVVMQIRNLESNGVPAAGPRRERLSQLYERTTVLVPEDAFGWRQRGRWYARLMSEDGGSSAFDEAEKSFGEALRRQPMSAGLWRERSAVALERATQDADALPLAVEYAVSTTRRYPNSAAVQWEAAYASLLPGGRRTPTGVKMRLDEMRRLRPAIRVEIGAAVGERQRNETSPAALETARKFAKRALELDDATPHLDKKLSHGERGWAKAILANP